MVGRIACKLVEVVLITAITVSVMLVLGGGMGGSGEGLRAGTTAGGEPCTSLAMSGDTNGDEVIGLVDPLITLLYLFKDGDPPVPVCSAGPATGFTDEQVKALIALLDYVEVTDVTAGGVTYPTVRFHGCNVQLVNDLGATNGYPADITATDDSVVVNGLGNFVIGYNEERTDVTDPGYSVNVRTGSHNIVVGSRNNYSSFGGYAGGTTNEASGPFAVVLGGRNNFAIGESSTVAAGQFNRATGLLSSIVGGGAPGFDDGNIASGARSTVSGGCTNEASGPFSSVTGGRQNEASSGWSSVTGGGGETAPEGNSATAEYSVVSGGRTNAASGTAAAVSGGIGNTASGLTSSASGGGLNTASGEGSSVSGGANNEASGAWSSITGGGGETLDEGNVALGDYSSVTGGRNNDSNGEASSVSGGLDGACEFEFDWIAGTLYEDE